MSGRKTQVGEANVVVEEEQQNYSDEEDIDDNDDDNESSDEIDTSSRLKQPLSYNRSLMDLYRMHLE